MFAYLKKSKTLILILFIALSSVPSWAQYRAKAKKSLIIKKISFDYLSGGQSGFEGFEPRGLASLQQTTKGGTWAKVEVQYRNYLDWIDEVSLNFYVLMSSGIVLTETISQINISKGPHHFAALFLHPSTLERYGKVKRIAVQVSHLGKIEDISQWPHPSKKEWWNQYPTQTGLLKKIFQTPFILDQPDRYEDTKW